MAKTKVSAIHFPWNLPPVKHYLRKVQLCLYPDDFMLPPCNLAGPSIETGGSVARIIYLHNTQVSDAM